MNNKINYINNSSKNKTAVPATNEMFYKDIETLKIVKYSEDIILNTNNLLDIFNKISDLTNKYKGSKKFFNKINETVKVFYLKNVRLEIYRLINEAMGNNKKASLLSIARFLREIKNLIKNPVLAQSKNYYERELNAFKKDINEKLFNNSNTLYDLEKRVFDKASSKDLIPFYLNLYLVNNITYKDNDMHISPKYFISTKTGDCSEVAVIAKYIFDKYGIESKMVGIIKNGKDIGHTFCAFKDSYGNWDYIEHSGLWNVNYKSPDELIKNEFNDVKKIWSYNLIFSDNGDLLNAEEIDWK